MVDIFVQGKVTEAGLLVSAAVHCLPGNRCLGIKVDPDEADLIDMGVNLEKAVDILVKVAELLELGSFGELAAKPVRPACNDT